MEYFTGRSNNRSNSNILDNSNIRTKSPKQALTKIMQLQWIDDKIKVILALQMIVDKIKGNTFNNQPITNEFNNISRSSSFGSTNGSSSMVGKQQLLKNLSRKQPSKISYET